MKAEDLRTLDGEELTTRLKGARRELYELRFKLAVGQLDDHRQIRQVRKDIARILTVVHARRLGEDIVEIAADDEPTAVQPTVEAPEEEPQTAASAATDVETPEDVETAAEPAPAPASRRTSRGKSRQEETGND